MGQTPSTNNEYILIELKKKKDWGVKALEYSGKTLPRERSGKEGLDS